MLNWDDVRVFLEVAERGTISAASAALQINHTTVSRRISALEARFDVKLFERANTGFALTAAGQALAEKSETIRDAMGEAERALAGSTTTVAGPLTVTAPSALVLHVLGPMVARFSETYPDIEIRLLSEDKIASLARREADVAIRATDAPEDFLVGRRLTSFVSTWYASGALQERLSGKALPWIDSDEGGARYLPDQTDQPVFQPFPSAVVSGKAEAFALARAGVGAALLPYRLGDAETCLRRVKGAPVVQGKDIWLLYHRDLRANPRVQTFSDFAFDEFVAERTRFEGRVNSG